ncbi:hypothetical protein V8B55DRAFT_1533378 [Mucor lusitanicus]|uniref:HMG box domain-containing protein n=1 Tax=Mucor circinelloides f. lusitanicus TaxID=29924 RepID=A0A8H4BEK9_MUCCL|nr:hypothetical protein FB192DRAFT_1382057 [Mucor lusitanicus]
MRYHYYNISLSDEEDESTRLQQLSDFLQHYKLSQYLDIFVSEGFDRLLSLFDITEADLISLNVKRGHRRLLQRAIATARGVPLSTPIVINYGYDEPDIAYTPKPGTTATAPTAKTTASKVDFFDNDIYLNEDDYAYYRRSHHRKRKQYVPSKPVTAFDELINEVQSQNSSMALSDITELAYQKWNKFTGVEKEKYEREALHANADYVMD